MCIGTLAGQLTASQIIKLLLIDTSKDCSLLRALCDTRNIGKLTKDQFALAIYLIQQKLKGVDPPSKLPPEMIPPSIRRSSLVVCSSIVSQIHQLPNVLLLLIAIAMH